MIYLISDLHIQEEHPHITSSFLKFMDQIEEDATDLYILGDFFESWIGDDENTPLQLEIKNRLKAFTSLGKNLFVMHGNRDFLIGPLFEEQTGGMLIEDPCIVELAGKQVLLMHGDSLCTKDLSYMKFRQTIRNPAFLEPFLKRSIEERKITAQQLRAMSQANNQEKDMEIMDVTPEEVVNEMDKHGVDTMIHGHTHRPAVHSLETAQGPSTRYVLGDWGKDFWFIKIDSESINLEKASY